MQSSAVNCLWMPTCSITILKYAPLSVGRYDTLKVHISSYLWLTRNGNGIGKGQTGDIILVVVKKLHKNDYRSDRVGCWVI